MFHPVCKSDMTFTIAAFWQDIVSMIKSTDAAPRMQDQQTIAILKYIGQYDPQMNNEIVQRILYLLQDGWKLVNDIQRASRPSNQRTLDVFGSALPFPFFLLSCEKGLLVLAC